MKRQVAGLILAATLVGTPAAEAAHQPSRPAVNAAGDDCSRNPEWHWHRGVLTRYRYEQRGRQGTPTGRVVVQEKFVSTLQRGVVINRLRAYVCPGAER